MLRWNIEVSYYENKTFWSLGEYRVRIRKDIECLVNLKYIAYSAMTLLPYSDESFLRYQSACAQETRYGIRQQIQASIIFNNFVEFIETAKKAQSFIKNMEGYVLSGFKKQKLQTGDNQCIDLLIFMVNMQRNLSPLLRRILDIMKSVYFVRHLLQNVKLLYMHPRFACFPRWKPPA